ncbi:Ku protein [Phenylobacterium sp. LjRoot219]|uniref:non-homologous end joining protein Ku n=1 Tax=Phenylobacterium sp. LjRoot219 TaxID=3342283 RepID=UPI003ED04C2B
MVSRPAWQGHLKLSLVTCPVALHAGVSAGDDVRLNMINPATGNRIRMQTVDPDTGPVERSALVKGYAIDKGLYVTLTDDELRSIKPESAGTIVIERFVPAADINRLFWDTPYYLAPDGDLALEAFSVIREAMRGAGQVALGRVVISSRERLIALEPQGNGIVAHTLRTRDEVRSAAEVFDRIPDAKVDPAMLTIARQIIEQHAGPFDPAEFVDAYTQALRELIESKRQTQAPARSAVGVSEGQVLDLMAALKASLDPKPRRAKVQRAAVATSRAPKISPRSQRKSATRGAG